MWSLLCLESHRLITHGRTIVGTVRKPIRSTVAKRRLALHAPDLTRSGSALVGWRAIAGVLTQLAAHPPPVRKARAHRMDL